MRNILIRLKESLKLVYPSKFGYRFLRCSAIISSFLGLACLAFSLIFLFNAGDVNFSGRIDLVKAGPIGDFIGGFIGIFWTISGVLLLFITLRMQADEFKATRDAVTKQQFESSFFNMLAILRTIRSELSIQSVNQSGIPTSLKGDEFFSYLNKVLNHSIFLKSHFSLDVVTKEVLIKTANLDESILLSDVQVFRGKLAGFIKEFLKDNDSKVGHYLRFFESITQTIVASRQYYEDENEYLIILRNQLSPQELIFLFYTALASYRSREDETNGLYSYFNKYSMVLNISETDLFDPTHQILYPSVIFPFLSTEAKLFKEKLFKLV